MLHPHTALLFVNEIVGHGVFATQPIPKGTITWVRDALDQELSPKTIAELNPEVRETILTYCYRNAKGNYILCWDHTKYINHSFNANCMTTPYGFEIAVRDIAEGEQLTNDYGTLNIIEQFEPCDEGHERKIIYPNDLKTFHAIWDQQIKDAITFLDEVEQPLQPYFEREKWQIIVELGRHPQLCRSLLECWYPSAEN
jgi:hypothetical protein